MAAQCEISHLEASELGTRDYWDKTYAEELNNHHADPNEEGTIWFSESGAEEKILSSLEDLHIEGFHEPNIKNPHLRILDIGTGNGHLLFALKDEAWKAEMIGVDYSNTSIQLARKIKENRLKTSDFEQNSLHFEQWDILKDKPGTWVRQGFDVVLDKGTFDAISLSDEIIEQNRRGCEIYAEKVQSLVKDEGFLFVISCNWTEDELKKWFEIPVLTVHATIKFPQYVFGGVKGQAVSAVCFQRRRRGM